MNPIAAIPSTDITGESQDSKGKHATLHIKTLEVYESSHWVDMTNWGLGASTKLVYAALPPTTACRNPTSNILPRFGLQHQQIVMLPQALSYTT
jgi:hypothetical protein